MSENKEEKTKPGTFRIVLAIVIIFGLVVIPLVGKYVWQGPVDQNLFTLISAIVGGIIGNIDRILSAFFGPKST